MSGLASRLEAACGVRMSRFTAARYRKATGWTRKKAYRTVHHVPDGAIIEDFQREYVESRDDDIVCIDEAGFYVGDMARRGYAPKGRRLNVAACKTLRRSKMTLLLAVSRSGVVHHEILDHNCRKDDFIAFVNRLPDGHGKTIVLDNVKFHRSHDTMIAIVRKGYKALFTPPYSPRFNAVEYVFSSLKQTYRSQCPIDRPEGFDYPSLLESVIATTGPFDTTFSHVRRCVKTTRVISGYDST